jgi:hypothetical protein
MTDFGVSSFGVVLLIMSGHNPKDTDRYNNDPDIDCLAIVPFDQILEGATNSRTNSMARLAKIGRLYKLVKLTRLLRILKIMKEKSKLLTFINQFLNLGLSFERLFFFMLVFIILSHISTCLWVMVAQI